jgi:hypothetical protein
MERAARHARAQEQEMAHQHPGAIHPVDLPVLPEHEIEGEMNPMNVHQMQNLAGNNAAVPPMALDPGMWLNMVNVKPPQLGSLEVEAMKKFILDYKRYANNCPPMLLRGIQQFVLDEQLKVIMFENGEDDVETIMALSRDEFIDKMLNMHHATTSQKWRIMVKNANMEKSDLSPSTLVSHRWRCLQNL